MEEWRGGRKRKRKERSKERRKEGGKREKEEENRGRVSYHLLNVSLCQDLG